MKNKNVYEIIFDYSTEDCTGIVTYIYSCRRKATNIDLRIKEIN